MEGETIPSFLIEASARNIVELEQKASTDHFDKDYFFVHIVKSQANSQASNEAIATTIDEPPQESASSEPLDETLLALWKTVLKPDDVKRRLAELFSSEGNQEAVALVKNLPG